MTTTILRPHSAHWGAFSAGWRDGELVVAPHPNDPDPNRLIETFCSGLHHRARVARPMVRRGWLDRGPGPDPTRGRDGYVAMEWDQVLDLLAAELARVRDAHGPGAIFGGSYGWASAGRFHHAPSQVHRFLNVALGGYVRSVNSYSAGAAAVILPHVFGSMDAVSSRNVTWEQIAEHTDVVLAFGGMAPKNSMVAGGGVSRHIERGAMLAARQHGCEFILVSPLRSDLPEEAGGDWVPILPGTDTALMLGMAHTLVIEGLHDRHFLARYCAGWEAFQAYLLGQEDATPKTAAWAAGLTGIDAATIAALARRLAGKRVVVAAAHAMQRSEHGEQPIWMAGVLAAMLGQIGLPGGGFSYALGALGNYGRRSNILSMPALPQGRNSVRDYIPVARIADMLLHPGEACDYNGEQLIYPDIRLVYWAGGNPFHHHQDLNRLRRALARVDTLVVHEHAWTATARHADILLPATMSLEREDVGSATTDPLLIAMHQVAEPYAQARNDYDIFAAIAARLGRAQEFTEGRTPRDWLRHQYAELRETLAAKGHDIPAFDEFWQRGEILLPQFPDDGGLLRAFRDDPDKTRLRTPSGRIEIFSSTIAGFGYPDCPGHPTWLPPTETVSPAEPLHLIANQPATRLHSQLDFGDHSTAMKRRGREVAHMNPADAAARGITDGDIIRLHNSRGACLACVAITEEVRPGVVHLPTGAWYDPEDSNTENPLCVHGNPNVLTRDVGTSRLAQGCTGQLTVVEAERWDGALPPIRAFDPPETSA
jgi:biotin/methionine sulfoxide reductase